MEIPLLRDIIIIFTLAIGVLLICHRFKIPTIVGFLLTGVLCGPHGLGLVRDITDVQTLASIGIVLLLFSVGMEFSLKKIFEMRRFFILGGLMQVGLTVVAGFGVAQVLGRPLGESVFLGFLLSLSSTAIVLKILEVREESDTPHGRVILSILIFQDIIAVPMMLITPLLNEGMSHLNYAFLIQLGKGLIILVLVFISAERIVPKLLYYVTRTRSRELFLLSVLVICFSVAWLASSVGLSLSLGAFLAGLIVSESEYSNEAIGNMLPLQDIFASFFFVSMGMLLDLSFVIEHPIIIVVITCGILVLKSFVASLTTLVVGMPLRTAVLSGIALSQVGEFSFVLAKSGIEYGLGTSFHYQLFLAVSLLTMTVTPVLIHFSPYLAGIAMNLPFPAILKTGLKPLKMKTAFGEKNHIIVIGFGLSGKNIAKSAKESKIPYVIIEMNSDTVRREKKFTPT